jgi:hypothetical protein
MKARPRHKAFHLACYLNHPECAEALARAGCDVGLKGKNGKTGRQLAEQRGHTALVQRLRKLQAERPPVGAVVRVCGLVGAAEHNGKLAAVRRHLPAKGRFELELLESGHTISVKPANFELVIVPVRLAVEVRGLVGAAEHNGKQGVVESRVGENGRCGVRIFGGEAGQPNPLAPAVLIGLKPANLVLRPEAQRVPEVAPAPADNPLADQLVQAAHEGDATAVALAGGHYIIQYRFQSKHAQRYIRLQLFPSTC